MPLVFDIPGYGSLRLARLVCDFNGTLAVDGVLAPDVAERLQRLSENLEIHVVTGDTYGTARLALAGLPVNVQVLPERGQAEAKLAAVSALGPDGCAVLGNGRNDAAMLRAAALGIAVIGAEGVAPEVLAASDLLVPGSEAALDLFLKPKRLLAGLRA